MIRYSFLNSQGHVIHTSGQSVLFQITILGHITKMLNSPYLKSNTCYCNFGKCSNNSQRSATVFLDSQLDHTTDHPTAKTLQEYSMNFIVGVGTNFFQMTIHLSSVLNRSKYKITAYHLNIFDFTVSNAFLKSTQSVAEYNSLICQLESFFNMNKSQNTIQHTDFCHQNCNIL